MYSIIYYEEGCLKVRTVIGVSTKDDILIVSYLYASYDDNVGADILKFQMKDNEQAENVVRQFFMFKEVDLTECILIND